MTGLEEFGLTERQLGRLGSRPVTLEIYLHLPPHVYPSPAMLKKLLHLRPEGRREMVHNWRVEALRKLGSEISLRDYKVVRSGGNPFGLRLTLPASAVRELFRLRHASSICVQRIEGFKRHRRVRVTGDSARLYAVKGRFAFQWEGQRRGMQLCEERLFLVMAKSERDARRRAGREFRSDTFPALYRSGHFGRWAFEEIVDVCEPIDREFSSKGTEVYYQYKKRRMRRNYEWHPGSAV